MCYAVCMIPKKLDKEVPGYHVRKLIESLELKVGEAARLLNVPEPNFSMILNGRLGISADMAVRLEKVFGEPAEYWLDLQKKYELIQSRKKKFKLKKFKK